MRAPTGPAGGPGPAPGEGPRPPERPGREWSPEDAVAAARCAGIARLGDRHWKVIAACREEAARSGRIPGLQRLESLCGVGAEEMHRLFPGDAADAIARIAGLAPARRRRGRPRGPGAA